MATAILAPATEEDERRFVLHGVPWSAYVALRDALDDQSRPQDDLVEAERPHAAARASRTELSSRATEICRPDLV